MEQSDYKKYYFALAISVIAIFWLNHNHLNQQGTYNDIIKPIAQNIIDGKGYTCERLGGGPLFYPIWGYTALVLIDTILHTGNYFILLIQAILCFLSIAYFNKLFRLVPRLWHLFLIFPYIALCSVKWPDAIAGNLLIFLIWHYHQYIEHKRLQNMILSGVFLGLLLNFRSEYLYLPFFGLMFLLLPGTKGHRKDILKLMTASLFIAILILLPWTIRGYKECGKPLTGATNGGAVSYIGLGQLPGNPWGITAIDKTVYDYAFSKGSKNPYSPEMDKEFSNKVKEKIKQYPGAFAHKAVYNIMRSLTGGVYTGEYANLRMSAKLREQLDSMVQLQSGQVNKFKFLLGNRHLNTIPMIAEKLIQSLFIPVYLFVLLYFLFVFIRQKRYSDFKVLMAIVFTFLLFRYFMLAGIQYEYRHMNILYLLLVGVYLKFSRLRNSL